MTQAEKYKILNDYKNYHNPRFPAQFRWDNESLIGLIEYVQNINKS